MGAEGVCFVTVFPEPAPRQVQMVFGSWRGLLCLLFLLASLRACSWNPVMKPITRLAGKTHAGQGGLVTLALQLLHQGFPSQMIDISWVSLCAPLRPGKNSFVVMLGAQSCEC